MSTSNAQSSAAKKRPYRMRKRAETQSETRRRIVEAAVDLHCTLGPARTTVAQIAERAGVQRHTYYAHFPDERGLFLACSEHALARDPLPDVEQWKTIPAGVERIRHGLAELYGWYERNSDQAACVLRDAEYHPLTREIVQLRMMPTLAAATELLREGLNERSRALLDVALEFACWRALNRTRSSRAAAKLMAAAVCGAAA